MSPPLQSKISGGLIFGSFFMALVLAISFFLLAAAWDSPDLTNKLTPIAFWALPVYGFSNILPLYFNIRVENGWVSMRGFFRQGSLPLSDITGYALLERKIKGMTTQTLHLALKDGSKVCIDSSLYRNYDAIRDALTEGVPNDPVLEAREKRARRRAEYYWLLLVFGILMLIAGVMWAAASQRSVNTADMQALRVSLSNAPFVEYENNRSSQSRNDKSVIYLHTNELPDLPFRLSDEALAGTNIGALTTRLNAGDTIRVMILKTDLKLVVQSKKMQQSIFTHFINVYAVSGKDGEFLSLESYNRAYKQKLHFGLLLLAINALIILLLAVWKYWDYKKLPNP